jgi:Xaa-Pro aminopeptidase
MQMAFETVKPGVTERRVAAEVEYAMRKKGVLTVQALTL